jgi:hypothetical protein
MKDTHIFQHRWKYLLEPKTTAQLSDGFDVFE